MHALFALAVLVIALLVVPFSRTWDASPVFAGLDAPLGLTPLPELGADDHARFFAEFWDRRPVILRGATRSLNARFRHETSPGELVRNWGNATLLLSTANTASYDKTRVSLRDYVEHMMGPQNETRLGRDTLYQFGDQTSDLDGFLALYDPLPAKWTARVNSTALSFGLSGTGTGVPFHMHGAVFAEVLHGRKRWFVTAPSDKPDFDGSQTTLFWFKHVLPMLSNRNTILDGICEVGDLLYLPSFWYHATLNIGQTVFMSSFVN